jgi:hypothetical protein
LSDAVADQVIPDDLIVQSSLCVGLDCVNNEVFNFATIRLKENNTRIDFTDTSGGGFPTRDWRLEANSSVGGGASYFAIKDMGNAATGAEGGTAIFTATAGAPANSIFVGATGNVGFGTSTPVLDLHVNTSDTPAIRLEQNSAGGFTAQTWDIAGNEASFFIRDVTGGSRLSLRIRPGAPSSSLDIAASGNVGIGTGSPQDRLHIMSTSANTGMRLQVLDNLGATLSHWSVFNRASDGNFLVQDVVAGTNPIRVRPGSPTGAIEISSNNIRFSQVLNCTAGVQTNANGVMSCLPSPSPRSIDGGSAANSAMLTASNASAVGKSNSQGGALGATGSEEKTGCGAEELAGNWSLLGTSVERSGDSSVLWCDVEFAPTGEGSFTYAASGQCRNHLADDASPQASRMSVSGTITGTSACRFSGGFEVKRGRTTVATATIIEGRVEGTGARKTRAVGVSRLTRGRANTMQTMVLQR